MMIATRLPIPVNSINIESDIAASVTGHIIPIRLTIHPIDKPIFVNFSVYKELL